MTAPRGPGKPYGGPERRTVGLDMQEAPSPRTVAQRVAARATERHAREIHAADVVNWIIGLLLLLFGLTLVGFSMYLAHRAMERGAEPSVTLLVFFACVGVIVGFSGGYVMRRDTATAIAAELAALVPVVGSLWPGGLRPSDPPATAGVPLPPSRYPEPGAVAPTGETMTPTAAPAPPVPLPPAPAAGGGEPSDEPNDEPPVTFGGGTAG